MNYFKPKAKEIKKDKLKLRLERSKSTGILPNELTRYDIEISYKLFITETDEELGGFADGLSNFSVMDFIIIRENSKIY